MHCAESDSKKTYMVYTRWGRVGVKGQSKLDGPYDSWDRAIEIFTNKFNDKTKNYWSDRKEFIPHPKSYTWLEMDYGKEENDSPVSVLESSLLFLFLLFVVWYDPRDLLEWGFWVHIYFSFSRLIAIIYFFSLRSNVHFTQSSRLFFFSGQ